MAEEFAVMVEADDLVTVLGGLFDRTLVLTAASHPTGGPRDHMVSVEATLISAVIAETMRRLRATGASPSDIYLIALRTALVGVAGEAALQGKMAVPPMIRDKLVSQFSEQLSRAHTLRRDG